MISLVIYNRDNKNSYRVIKEFKRIYDLDNYTSHLNNEDDLLENIRNLSNDNTKKVIDNFLKGCNNNISLGFITNRKKFNKIEKIMYKNDTLDADEVIFKFTDYFLKNYKEVIDKWHIGIKQVIENMSNLDVKKEYTINELNMILNSYLKDDNYKKIRNIYFILKSKGLIQEKKDDFYLSYHDDYYEQLQRISIMNEEDYDFVNEEFHNLFDDIDKQESYTMKKRR